MYASAVMEGEAEYSFVIKSDEDIPNVIQKIVDIKLKKELVI